MTYTSLDDVAGDSHIDSRDLIELRDSLAADLEDETPDSDIAQIDELEAEGISEWEDGAHLIREDQFEDYARELAEDIGAISGSEGWPLGCIDWPKAARELAYDYSTVTFLGYDYFVRS